MPTLPPILRGVVDKVRHHPSVKNVTVKYRVICVEFNDGIKENWAIRPGPRWWRKQYIPPSGWFKSDLIIANKYESDLFDDEWNQFIKPHFQISRKNIVNAGFCDIRLKIHTIIISLLKEGWIDIKHDKEEVQKDFQMVKEANRKPFILSPLWIKHRSSSTVPPGYCIITHCSDWGNLSNNNLTLKEAWKDPTILYYAIDRLIKKKRMVSRDNITRKIIATGKAGVKFANPCFYSALINNYFKMKNPVVLDAAPDIGSKAIGVKAIGGTYNYVNNQIISDKISEFIGDINKDDGNDSADITFLNDIYDKTLKWTEILDTYRHRSDVTIAFVRRDNITKVKADKIIRCTIRPGGFDYLAIYYS